MLRLTTLQPDFWDRLLPLEALRIGAEYTVGLLQSVPRLDVATTATLAPIRGEIPSLMNLPAGCAFRDRCDWAVERCAVDDPPLLDVGKNHTSACWEHARVELKRRVAAR